eukprot:Gb_07024 [translate_table: standard]
MTKYSLMDIIEYASTNVVIVRASFVGLSYSYELRKNPNMKVTISNLYALGAYDELKDYVVIKHAMLFASTIIIKVFAGTIVKLFNAGVTEDMIKNEILSEVVINWDLV